MGTLEAIKETLNGILEKTKQKKIIWTFGNPNTFKWIKMDNNGPTSVLLQRQLAADPNSKDIYLIIIQPTPKLTPQITPSQKERAQKEAEPIHFSSKEHPELHYLLSSIFDTARAEAERQDEERKAEIIKGLLDGI
jgi:hypothetical protein